MNWDAIGAIAESIGAIGVITSLIYLAIQVRQSAGYTRTNTRTQLQLFANEIIKDGMKPEIVNLKAKLASGDTLTFQEESLRDQRTRQLFRNAELSIYHNRAGTLEDSEFEGELVTWSIFLTNDYERRWWLDHRTEFPEEIRVVLDALVN
ncbi:MAG: hypothetical protein GKR90_25145 [Pseudomonadales bacterium]|nr:hypothetical protein [Pseudomonadales bacterium]